ncbi:hypothetical protein M1D89_10090 [Arthrobacter sp. D3-18]
MDSFERFIGELTLLSVDEPAYIHSGNAGEAGATTAAEFMERAPRPVLSFSVGVPGKGSYYFNHEGRPYVTLTPPQNIHMGGVGELARILDKHSQPVNRFRRWMPRRVPVIIDKSATERRDHTFKVNSEIVRVLVGILAGVFGAWLSLQLGIVKH